MKRLLDLESRECRWPVSGDRAENYRFCGAQTGPGRSYCDQHHAVAYRPNSQPGDNPQVETTFQPDDGVLDDWDEAA